MIPRRRQHVFDIRRAVCDVLAAATRPSMRAWVLARRNAFFRMAALAALAGVWYGGISVAGQRFPTLLPSELPLGLGIVSVTPVPRGALHFYNPPLAGEAPDDVTPVDSVTFRAGLPSVDIAEAPPWFVPEHLKMDYELLHLRALTLTPDWIEVIGNSRTGETRWVRRQDVRFASWPEHLLSVAAVQVFDAESTPVRVRPLDDSPALATTVEPLPPLAVQGDWLKVSIHHLADRMPPEGWVRWRRGDRLLVVYSPLS